MRSLPGRSAAAAVVIGLASAGTIVASSPAVAASSTVYSNPVVWEGVNDATGGIDDAHFQYPGTQTMPGWTHDAFDGIGRLTVSGCSAGSGSVVPAFTSAAPPVVNDGGTSVFSLVSTGTVDAANCGTFTIQATITLQGSFARWDYALSGDFEGFAFSAAIGSDSDGAYSSPDASTVLISDTSQFSPSIALQGAASGGGSWQRASNNIDISYVAAGTPTIVSVVAAVADYTWVSGRADADAHLASIASTLSTTSFGSSLPLFHGTDSPDFAAQSLTTGSAVDTVAAFTYDAGLFRGLDYFDNTQTGHVVQALLGTLPAGLTGTVAYAPTTGAPVVTLTGTPTTPGTYSVPVTFFQLESNGVQAKPLFATLPIVVAAVAPTGGGESGGMVGGRFELAATGTDAPPLLLAAVGALLAGLAALSTRPRPPARVRKLKEIVPE